MASTPQAFTRAKVSFSPSSLISAKTRLMPALAACTAMPLPIPLPAPVTTATLLLKSFMYISPYLLDDS